jgi:hypothetical protein
MHCPRCGQEQVSEEIKFCSRCGFPLGLVSEILAHGGFLPQLADLHKREKTKFTKKNGVMFSVFWFIFFVLIMTPFWGIMDVDKMAGICAIIGVFGGLMLLIGSLTLLKSESKILPMSINDMQQPNVHNLSGLNQNQNALPPQRSQPVNTYVPPQPGSWQAPNTEELVNPGSVVDHTTKLLQKDK